MSGPQSHHQQQQQQQQSAQTPPLHLPINNDQNYTTTLPGVLHYLQSEWRRFERDRNDWEIEKSDLKSRIAFLESERRSTDNIKTDLLRRIKMLEYALRQERSKYSVLHSQSSGQLLAENAFEVSASPEPGAGIGTAGVTNTIGGERGMMPDMLTSEYGSLNSNSATLNRSGTLLHYSKGVGHMRTREILKNYLREAGQLTAPNMVAGLPLRTNDEESMSGLGERFQNTTTSTSSSIQYLVPIRPKPVISRPAASGSLASAKVNGSSDNLPTTDLEELDSTPTLNASSLEAFAQNSLNKQNTVKRTGKMADGKLIDPEPLMVDEVQEKLKLPTAEKTQKMMHKWVPKSSITTPTSKQDDPLALLSLSEDDTDESTGIKKTSESRDSSLLEVIWRPKVTLRSHMDAVRSVALHPTALSIISGSEDCTAKLWSLQDFQGIKQPLQDVEATVTYRGHTGPITAVSFGSGTSPSTCFTASMDSTIREWGIPPSTRDVYAPYDSKLKIHTYVGHSNAVWDVKPQPSTLPQSILASCAADGTVKIWNTNDDSRRGLKSTIWFDGAKKTLRMPSPTSLDWITFNMTRLVVAYQDSAAKVFDVNTGGEILSLKSNDTFDGTLRTQINKIVCHSTLSLAFTAHEDRFIRIFDLNSGQCIHSMIAHLDAVTTLDIHPLGLSFVSGGHDCSMRFWDLSTRNCVQEYSSHRRKGNEGMWSAKFHPTLHDTLASCGADSTVKLYRYGAAS